MQPTTTTSRSGFDDSVSAVTTSAKTRRGASQISAFEASAISMDLLDESQVTSPTTIPQLSVLEDFCMPVLWTSLLITSNTVGAGMLILPELCQGPGMGLSMGLFTALYLINLLSGLLIAEVAINQRETSGRNAPSSFKAFAEEIFQNPLAKDGIAAVSVIKNALVLAFGTIKAGQLGADIFAGGSSDAANLLAMGWAVAFAALLGTQSAPNLSKVASMFVVGLFASFAAILLPGLAGMEDPMAVFMAPGTSSDPMASALQVAPIILMSFIFQNIVPTTARILDYDRNKIVTSMVVGTLFPFLMYTAWCLAVLGGGVDTSVGLNGPLFTIFSVVTIAGSHLGSCTSMAEELDTYLVRREDKPPSSLKGAGETDRQNYVFSWGSVTITAALAVILGEVFSGNLNDSLKIAGAYGSPFLYFLLPAAMAWNQRAKNSTTTTTKDLVPFGMLPLGVSVLIAIGFVGSEMVQSFGTVVGAV